MNGLYAPGTGPDPGPGQRIASASQMRTLDARAVAEFGVSVQLLMENAGRAAADAVEMWMAEEGAAGSVLVLAGPGNNGGDGYSFARTLRARGQSVELWRIVGPGAEKEPRPEVQLHRALWERAGGKSRTLDGGAGEMGRFADEFAALEAAFSRSAVVVDALFGTGLSRPLGEPFGAVLQSLVQSGQPVVALDVPSGLDADTGQAMGQVAPARMTVTFAALKRGLLVGDGLHLAGRVLAAEIGLPPALLAELDRYQDADGPR